MSALWDAHNPSDCGSLEPTIVGYMPPAAAPPARNQRCIYPSYIRGLRVPRFDCGRRDITIIYPSYIRRLRALVTHNRSDCAHPLTHNCVGYNLCGFVSVIVMKYWTSDIDIAYKAVFSYSKMINVHMTSLCQNQIVWHLCQVFMLQICEYSRMNLFINCEGVVIV